MRARVYYNIVYDDGDTLYGCELKCCLQIRTDGSVSDEEEYANNTYNVNITNHEIIVNLYQSVLFF